MNISAIFEKNYDGVLTGVVWIIDTIHNRNRFKDAADLDPQSALFLADQYKTKETALCDMILGIQDHYPDWEVISVIGFDLETSTTKSLQNSCEIAATGDGFICKRFHLE